MTDIRLAQKPTPYEAVTLDFLLTPLGDLDTTQELATAVTVALLTDGLASEDDRLPDPNSDDRRGWWADLDALELWDGWPIGSKLWLIAREKLTPVQARQGSTTARIEAYIRDAVQPLLDRKIATQFDVAVTRVGTERIAAQVTLYRGSRQSISLRFADLWDGIVVSAPTGYL